jgi:hypothetical protein
VNLLLPNGTEGKKKKKKKTKRVAVFAQGAKATMKPKKAAGAEYR